MSAAGYIKDDQYQFLLEYFTGEKIYRRFAALWNEVVVLVKRLGLKDKIRIDEESFQHFILDYFADIARLKDFHGIKFTKVSKIYAYTLYWFLKRCPLQLTAAVPDNFDINEKIGVGLTLPKMMAEAGLEYGAKSGSGMAYKAHIRDFVNLLFYNLKYRTYTPQSLELMIEAFLCGCACFKH
jgi:hypothetical protein